MLSMIIICDYICINIHLCTINICSDGVGIYVSVFTIGFNMCDVPLAGCALVVVCSCVDIENYR